MSPLVKCMAACVLAELVLLSLFGAITHSLISAATCSLGLGGPLSVWLGPLLLRRFRAQVQTAPSAQAALTR